MNEKHLENFRRIIQKETISLPNMTDLSKFREFHVLLSELFPSLWQAAIKEDFNGSLLIKWPGKSAEHPILLMNHHDVVEENGEWPEHGAFSADIAGGRIWGRGTLDTKAGLWAMLQAADDLASEGFVPENDVYFESACNEEISGAGAREISKELEERGIRFRFVLDEGSFIIDNTASLGLGEKGVNELQFIARSSGGHASRPPFNSPLVRLGRFMAFVDDNRDTVFPPQLNPQTNTIQQTSCAFTMAEGAKARNVLPREASVIASVRTSHHQGVAGSIKALEDAAKKFDIETVVLFRGIDSYITDTDSEGYNAVCSVIKEHFPGINIKTEIMAGATDACYMSNLSDAVIRFLPFSSDAEQVSTIHSANENIYADTLEPGVEFYKKIIKS